MLCGILLWVPTMKADPWSVCYSNKPLAAGCAQSTAETVNEGAPELKPESKPGPSQLAAHHPCSLPQAFMWSHLQKPSSRGNVSLLASQETSMPKQGVSCPDTALPVGYVRTFLLSPSVCVSVSLSHSFGRLPFGKLPECKPFFPLPSC